MQVKMEDEELAGDHLRADEYSPSERASTV